MTQQLRDLPWRFDREAIGIRNAADEVCCLIGVPLGATSNDLVRHGSLIAAAPDLEAALEKLVSLISLHRPEWATGSVLVDAHAALNKARG